jgi:hypothetical protein
VLIPRDFANAHNSHPNRLHISCPARHPAGP